MKSKALEITRQLSPLVKLFLSLTEVKGKLLKLGSFLSHLKVLRSAVIWTGVEGSSDSDIVVRTAEWELFFNIRSFVGVLCCVLLKLLEKFIWLGFRNS